MERVTPPTIGDWAGMMAQMQRAYLVAPWIVGAKYCETMAANLAGRSETNDGVPVGNLFRPDHWSRLMTAWSVDALAGSNLKASLQKVRPDQLELFKRELKEAARIFEAKGWAADPVSFHGAPPPAPNNLRIVREHRGGEEAKLIFESGYQPKPELPGSDDYAAMKKLHTVEARVLRHTDRRDRPWIVFLHGFAMGNNNDLDVAGGKKLFDLGYNVVTVPYPFHGNRCIGMPGEGALGLDIMTMLNAQAQGLWDVRRTIGWIRENHPGQRIGAYGASMGGFATAMLAGLEKLDCAIGVIPAFGIAAGFEESAGQSFGAEYGPLARSVLAPLDASRFPPLISSDKLSVIAAIADGITPPDQAIAMQKHFGGSLDWIIAGHLTAFEDAQPALQRILRRNLLEGAELPARKMRRLL